MVHGPPAGPCLAPVGPCCCSIGWGAIADAGCTAGEAPRRRRRRCRRAGPPTCAHRATPQNNAALGNQAVWQCHCTLLSAYLPFTSHGALRHPGHSNATHMKRLLAPPPHVSSQLYMPQQVTTAHTSAASSPSCSSSACSRCVMAAKLGRSVGSCAQHSLRCEMRLWQVGGGGVPAAGMTLTRQDPQSTAHWHSAPQYSHLVPT